MKSNVRTLFRFTPVALSVVMVAACGSDEPLPTEDHTAVTFNVLVNDVEATAPYTFATGQTVRVRLKFFNAAQDDLDDVEAEHFGGLTFNPVSRATATRVTGHNYQFDVTGGTPGAGTLQVSYGHDQAADEVTFNPEPLTVSP